MKNAPRKRYDLERILVAVVWIALILAIWEGAAFILAYKLDARLALQKLPYFHQIVRTFIGNFPDLLDSGMVTLSKSFTGFAYGALIGFALAVLMSWSDAMEKIAFPYLILSQMIPILGLAPIIYNIVRNGDASRIIIAAYITFFPVSINMLSGLKSVEPGKIELMHSYAVSRFAIYVKLLLPASMPHLFTGLKIAAPMSVTAAIVVELLGTDSGIGVKILYTLYYGSNAALMFWSSILMAIMLGVFSYLVVSAAERVLIPWENFASGEKAV
jgi:NitT/TauT family transport system permease protein